MRRLQRRGRKSLDDQSDVGSERDGSQRAHSKPRSINNGGDNPIPRLGQAGRRRSKDSVGSDQSRGSKPEKDSTTTGTR